MEYAYMGQGHKINNVILYNYVVSCSTMSTTLNIHYSEQYITQISIGYVIQSPWNKS